MIEVVALHYHIVELKEAESFFHSLLVTFGTKHIVDREAGADLTQNINIVEIKKPVRIVYHNSLIIAKFNEAAHLLFEAGDVVVDILFRQHFSHIGSARGIADHSRAAAEQGNGTVACHLKSFHQAERHKVTDMKAVGGRIKADVENRLAVVDKLLDFVLVRHLSNKSTGDKLVINSHNNFPFI